MAVVIIISSFLVCVRTTTVQIVIISLFWLPPAPPHHDCLTNACYFGLNISPSDPFGALPVARPKKNANEVPRSFSDMCLPEIFDPPIEIRMFGPKTAIFALKYAFLSTYRHCHLFWCHVGWWLWCYSFYMVFK